jgi:hypothetical protein
MAAIGWCLIFGATAFAADDTKSETGALHFYLDGGGSFGLPANRASVTVGSVTATSPRKTALGAVGVGAAVTAWRWVVPFVDVTAYDAGTASASVGPVNVTVADKNTFSTTIGTRLVKGAGSNRAFVQLGGAGSINRRISRFPGRVLARCPTH